MLPSLTSRLFSYPKSDKNRIILPFNHINGTYAEDYIKPSLIGNRCNPQDIYILLDTIYKETSNLVLLRICFKVKSVFLTLMLIGLLLIIYGAATTYYAAAYTGVAMTALVLLIFYFQIKTVRRQVNEELPELHKNIKSIINRFSDRFEINHLRWEVPANCLWLEFWYNNTQELYMEIGIQGGQEGQVTEKVVESLGGMDILKTQKVPKNHRSKSTYTALGSKATVEKAPIHNMSLNDERLDEDA